MNRRIIFIHSLNNFTGSANILSIIVRDFASKGYSIDIITNRSYGFLSDVKGINYIYTSYKWSDNKLKTLFSLFWSQLEVFFIILLKYNRVKGLFYINTIIPFGAAWACKILNKERVYHVHEDMFLSKPIYPFYRFTYKYCNQKSIFVSNYLRQVTKTKAEAIVAYNALSPDFMKRAEALNDTIMPGQRTILMVASLRAFKGINEFLDLARNLPQYSFELVVSSTPFEVETFRKNIYLPTNLSIFSQQDNLDVFYRRAGILLNLTHPETVIETFGLTILEAMAYGVPAIVPPVGGPIEIVENGINGYTIDPLALDDIGKMITELMTDHEKYSLFSKNALLKSKKFESKKMISDIENFIFR